MKKAVLMVLQWCSKLVDSAISVCRLSLLTVVVCLPCPSFGSAAVSAVLDSPSGLFKVKLGGATAVVANAVFWGPSWQWANPSIRLEAVGANGSAPAGARLSGTVEGLGLAVSGRVAAESATSMQWRWRLTPAAARSGVVGGGISFKFALEQMVGVMGVPELLPNGRGWAWGKAETARVEMRFDPIPKAVEFERGQKGEVRIFFLRDAFGAEPMEFSATLSVFGPGAGIVMGPGLQAAATEVASWREAPGRPDDSALDLSGLNAADRPAGRLGRITARGDELLFGDGRPARLWGTNISAYALFQTHPADVKAEAKRLARMGYNLVRLHHHDSIWVDPNIFGVARRFDTQEINERMARQIDWWIKCLRDEGIYVWLDLHVGRQVRSQDKITAYEEIAKGGNSAGIFGYNYVNASIQEAMWQFARQYLTRKNVETGLSAIEDPAVAFVLLTNENDLTHHFGNALLADKNVPWHHGQLKAAAAAFAKANNGPSADALMRTWEHGPSKRFLNDLEYRTHARTVERLRALGNKALVASTNFWGNNPIVSLPALTVGDVIDVHNYAGEGQLGVDPRFGDTLFDSLVLGSVLGRPTTVTEWGIEPVGVPDRHALPLLVAARSAQQGIDALMFFAHTQGPPLGRGGAGPYDAYADPLLNDLMPLAALIYRGGLVSEATRRFVYQPDVDRFYGQALSPEVAGALRVASRLGKLQVRLPATAELPWLVPGDVPPGATVLTDANAVSSVPSAGQGIHSDNGELAYDWATSRFEVHAPRALVMSSLYGGVDSASQGVTLRSTTSNATVAVISLDDKPLQDAARIVVAIAARASQETPGRLPYRVEPTSLRVRWAGRDFWVGSVAGALGTVAVLKR